MPENQAFLQEKRIKKAYHIDEGNRFGLFGKAKHSGNYAPTGAYDFSEWKDCFDDDIWSIYEHLHEDLLYTNEKQEFAVAVQTFEKISALFADIGE